MKINLHLLIMICFMTWYRIVANTVAEIAKAAKSKIEVISVTEITFEMERIQVVIDSRSMPKGLPIEYPLSGIVLNILIKITNVAIPISSIRSSQVMP